ncbi:MAG: hypothetical protein WC845_02525 [Candidatus Staskawiczbacteria bacterium]|jgi:hypothetical protein
MRRESKLDLIFIALVVGILIAAGLLPPKQDTSISNSLTAQSTAIPVRATPIGYGRYISYTKRGGKTYAGVVFPEISAWPVAETRRPGAARNMARMYLAKYDKRQHWVDEKREVKGVCLVYIFRLMTEEEVEEATKAKKEMAQPLVPQ